MGDMGEETVWIETSKADYRKTKKQERKNLQLKKTEKKEDGEKNGKRTWRGKQELMDEEHGEAGKSGKLNEQKRTWRRKGRQRGGGCHDASHVMRLDFTITRLKSEKQSRGLTHMRGVDNGRREAK